MRETQRTSTSSSFLGRCLFFFRPVAVFSTWLFIGLLLQPDSALAFQSHGAPEGLYVHQMAHINFILALGYLYWDIRRSSLDGKGWRYLQAFCIVMLCWNILAFVGHAVAVYLHPDSVTAVGGYLRGRIQGPIDLQKLTFYIAKFDHLLAVPALFFLYIGMRSLYRAAEKHAGKAVE